MTLSTSVAARPFINLSNRANAKRFWERIQNHWGHQHLPSGQRFLGSVGIERESTEEILDIVGENLGRLESVTSTQLRRYFGEHETNWIKFLTFALSEYAYYDDGNHGYWQGLCDRLDIYYSQGTTQALQQVVWQGIKELGLVKSSKANRYVSSLWLQSGIPCQNLGHFADLLQVLDYDWWDIAHADPVDLAQLLCDVCQHKFPYRGRLLTFLRSSCPEDHEEETDPISGTLLQGLATVAHELERRGESPEILRDEVQRTRVLQNYSLPNTFFLRSWDSLINVLTPRSKKGSSSSIISQRRKPLSLLLDITDSFDIQLVLPEQEVYRKEWKQLQAEYCTIPEGNWEGVINIGSGVVKIPELRQTLTESAEQWAWQLRSHNDTVLLEWHHPGIQPEQLCLIFDADTGELRSPQQLALSPEIILFTPETVQRQYSDGLEIIDSFVPCSLSGWRGHWLQRTGANASIRLNQGHQEQTLSWQMASQQPQLQGVRLKGRQPTFLATPALWYPPLPIGKTLNLLVEDMDQRQTLTEPNQQTSLPPQNDWQAVDLSPWIAQPGTYSVRLWTTTSQWSALFTVQNQFQLTAPPPQQDLDLLNRQQIFVQTLPMKCLTAADFWLEELTLKGLWPLETATFELTNGQETHRIARSASHSGAALLALAALRDVLPETDRYALHRLDYSQRQSLISWNFPETEAASDPPQPGDSPPIPKTKPSPEPLGATYWIQLDKRKVKRFLQLIDKDIKQESISEFVSFSVDPSLKEYVQVRLEDQSYKPILDDICIKIGRQLNQSVQLILKQNNSKTNSRKPHNPSVSSQRSVSASNIVRIHHRTS
ncbi:MULTISPECIES: hypothetical protein [Cyanophyceae]|uniref:hypothetical protein n=1 Tax=Cyanophyceae TaxID=3028117 RepID=UPI001687E147|nr:MULTISPECIES: hypothetical protein [Cyanophyceae]MBD1916253.1 hypothetical protein [Phormidium sp. FACHB-77]MBD2031478.1 hypothetical protein [Phormidium sp. FACHB-322]MBD2052895.1 hypothetical protein [Leptolyngbya sp. FACHB-60]